MKLYETGQKYFTCYRSAVCFGEKDSDSDSCYMNKLTDIGLFFILDIYSTPLKKSEKPRKEVFPLFIGNSNKKIEFSQIYIINNKLIINFQYRNWVHFYKLFSRIVLKPGIKTWKFQISKWM